MADKPLAFAWLNAVGPPESLAIDRMDPATAGICRMQLVKQHMLFKQQTAALRSAVKAQVQLANEIPVFVDEGGKAVQVWNPLEVVKAEVTAAQALQGVLSMQRIQVAPVVCMTIAPISTCGQNKVLVLTCRLACHRH